LLNVKDVFPSYFESKLTFVELVLQIYITIQELL